MTPTLTRLRRRIDAVAAPAGRRGGSESAIRLGAETLDRRLGGALLRGSLHELFAATTPDAAALTGFAAGFACRVAGRGHKIVWVRQSFTDTETGGLFMPGLAALGLDPGRLVAVRVRRPEDVLRAGLEAARCGALGAVVIDIWGRPGVLDLTATRRLALAASRSGVTPLLLRTGAAPQPSVAQTRWQVAAAPSAPLAANAPGRPAFAVTLLRNRAGASGQRWHLEWDHERQRFGDLAALSRPLDAVPLKRPAEAPEAALARTG
ncbi:MAG: hypothetical protein QNJ13_15730 [Paracoccaceae bacterium]|nr:hypothetical protein [Paracoccaceae bacterium]